MDYTGINLNGLEQELIAFRRERHMYPENGWTEFLTTSVLVKKLQELGLTYKMGKSIHTAGERYGVPGDGVLESCMARAVADGADPELVEQMRGGYTGVVATVDTGRPGPTTALRVDIDCVDVDECRDDAHRPHREGFASRYPRLTHACGHDAHMAIGLGVATVVAQCREQLCGKVMIIFQPAEEGTRGSASVAGSGILEGVDYLFGGHVTAGLPYGQGYAGTAGLASSYKADLTFTGLGAHAGASPELGHNAAAAAANTILNCLAISRHGKGTTRVNIGAGEFGPGRNVIPDYAVLKAEVRGGSNELNDYMFERMMKVCESSAAMYDCSFSCKIMGHSIDAPSDPEISRVAMECAAELDEFESMKPCGSMAGAGDDVTALMAEVQRHGGKAAYLQIGCDGKAPHHNPKFDLNEKCIMTAVKLYTGMIGKLNARAD